MKDTDQLDMRQTLVIIDTMAAAHACCVGLMSLPTQKKRKQTYAELMHHPFMNDPAVANAKDFIRQVFKSALTAMDKPLAEHG